MIRIKEYDNKYAKGLSEVILDNLYTINIKDHGKEVVDRIALHFTEDEILKNFPKRKKSFVAVDDNEKVVGTASIDRYKEDETGTKYILLTVFVKIENHHQGIGTKLINSIEKYAKGIGAKELIIPASVYAVEFYKKFGFDYSDGKKEQNEDKEYMLVKYY